MISANPQEALHQASALIKQGALIDAYDLLRSALQLYPDHRLLHHRAVMTLARAGALEQAMRDYKAAKLDQVTDDEDIIALGGRLLKDQALAAPGGMDRSMAYAAIGKYRQAFQLRRSAYPAVNMATLHALLGEQEQADEICHWILTQAANPGGMAGEQYFDAATRAEALTILGRSREADDMLRMAIALCPDDLSARASTLRQLEYLCRAQGQDLSWLDPHRPADAAHYCGHMIILGHPDQDDDIARTGRLIDEWLDKRRPGALFGALAAGVDLMVAERALARGIDLHVVLPFLEEDFLRCSVVPCGASWAERYHFCRDGAASFRVVLPEPYLGDDAVYSQGACYAMGLTIRHAQLIRSHARQLCVWDGVTSSHPSGTAIDGETWRKTGLPQDILPFPKPLRQAAPRIEPKQRIGLARKQKAILFGDIQGFSRLAEHQMPIFTEKVMGSLAESLAKAGLLPERAATWGDGLYLTFDHVADAALAAILLQNCLGALPLESWSLPPHLALRIGGHVGPLTEMRAPFTGRPADFGTHATIAARIEPTAMPGSVFVSEAFNALLAVTDQQQFEAQYVGIRDLPKSFGAMRLYTIRPAV
jgi:class 3 adenylate cyclase/tetratricopeptide (TPR) repeat protein